MADSTLVRKAADLLVGYPFTPWFYGDSVGFEGLLCASDLLGDRMYEGFVHGMARGAIARDDQPRQLDNTVPGKVLTDLAVRTGDERLLEGLGALVRFIARRPTLKEIPVSLERAGLMKPYGGAELPPDEAALVEDPGPAVYVDCLHFDPPFLVSYGRATDDGDLVESGVAMAESFARLLQGDGGVFDHFYLGRTGRTYIPGWSRGQGWAVMGLLDVIETVGVGHERVAYLEDSLARLARAMVASQLSSGHWGSLTTEESPAETSAAAFFAAAFLRMGRLGLGTPETASAGARAFHAMMGSVDEGGQLRGVSATVWSSTQVDHYKHVPMDHMVPWSQGPLLMALHEHELAGSG
jgi:unsaturated rhamnogalacturonyl hydrolase